MIRRATPDELDLCLALRRRVFIEEQGVSEAEEIDGRDADAIHLLAEEGGRVLGTARLLLPPGGRIGKIGRVCVLPEARGTGLGAALIRAALDECRRHPTVQEARLGAQTHALGFYQRLGFQPFGPEYLDAGITHRDMKLPLRPPLAEPDP
ncbi:GNAT family N-acetyltransferase [Pseudogemmobacter sonorensis]|uniref:GNAT family N-acetyltransferase n=1 Tax=Pseudogemmobacter sonorensis TaxID=2989681 RepID=UPI00369ECC9C